MRLSYSRHRKVDQMGYPELSIYIYVSSDRYNTGAPMYKTGKHEDLFQFATFLDLNHSIDQVAELVKLKADLSQIPSSRIPKCQGADGHSYYYIEYEIQVTYYSANTKYELIHDNINYGEVIAECV